MQVFLTTTGTQANTFINDLGKAKFVHPRTNIPLIEPLGEFTEQDVSNSANLIAAVSSGFITLTNIDGTNITTLSNITDKTNDHGNQTGLLDDDHTQYLNNSRGDARYISQTLTSGNIIVGNGSNVASSVALSGDATITNSGVLNLSNVGTAGTYQAVTVDAKGRVTAGTNPTTLAGYGITDAQPLDADLTSLAALTTTGITTRTAANTFTTRTNTGTTNRLTVTNGNGVAGNPTYDIASTYVGQSSITTLGTITTGTWNGTTLGLGFGGTGSTTANGALNNLLPSQTGNANRSLVTNGTNTSWVLNTLQTAYNNSGTTEIVTNTTNGAVTFKRGSTSDADVVFNIEDGTGLSNFEVIGNGLLRIKKPVFQSCLYLQPSTGVTDPNLASRPARLYIESDRTNTIDGLRLFFNNQGNPDFGGYMNFGYNGSSPEFTMIDMDEDPNYLTFSIARSNLATNPGTFAAPAIISKFGNRGTVANGLTGFSWLSNGGTSGGTLVEIMSLDSNFLCLPNNTTALRSAVPINGMISYNSTLNRIDAYQNGGWTQYIDTTTAQSGITGDKIFTNKVKANTNIVQYFNATSVTTTITTFATITGMSLTTTTAINSTYNLEFQLNVRMSTTAVTVIEVQVFVNGVADADSLISVSQRTNVTPVFIPFKKLYTNISSNTTFDVRWRRVSGIATPTVTNKSLIIQECL